MFERHLQATPAVTIDQLSLTNTLILRKPLPNEFLTLILVRAITRPFIRPSSAQFPRPRTTGLDVWTASDATSWFEHKTPAHRHIIPGFGKPLLSNAVLLCMIHNIVHDVSAILTDQMPKRDTRLAAVWHTEFTEYDG